MLVQVQEQTFQLVEPLQQLQQQLQLVHHMPLVLNHLLLEQVQIIQLVPV